MPFFRRDTVFVFAIASLRPTELLVGGWKVRRNGWLPCPRPGEELQPQMRCVFTFGFVFPKRRWDYGSTGCRGAPTRRPWHRFPPAMLARCPSVKRQRLSCKMKGAGSPSGRREPLLRLSELSMEGGKTAT